MPTIRARNTIRKLGEDLRDARLRRGMSMADLAERAGTSERTISRLEHGDQGVALGTLAEIMRKRDDVALCGEA